MDSNITLQTKQMIDSLKAVCTNFGLGNASSEYKIITEVFLYKFLNDKFLFEAKRVEPALAKLSPADAEKQLAQMTDDDYELFLLGFGPDTAKLKQTHFISYLFNRKNEENFHTVFDDTLLDIATYNIDIFSVRTGGQSKMRLFSGISQHVIEAEKKDDFCRAIIDKIAECSFDSVFEQKYDFFAQIFEYLIKDYNKDFGKYAEYYTPHSIASIIAKIMVPNGAKNVTVYDPAAGSGTLVLALAHEIGESNCTIYTQDISQKSNEFLRLNLILNNLVHSLPNVVHDDTLLRPYHKNAKGDGLATFDYIVSNPPFNMDFSDSRDTLAGDNYKKRFWAGVPNIPNKDKDKMAIYLMFLQHIIYSLGPKGKAAVVVPTGFLTAGSGIQKKIREHLVKERMLRGVISMPSNIFASTGTTEEGYKCMQDILAAHPDIAAVFCGNDREAVGAAQAIADAGLTNVKVAGFDADESGIEAVRIGHLACTVQQFSYDIGYQCVVLMDKLLRGEAVEYSGTDNKEILVPCALVTKEDIPENSDDQVISSTGLTRGEMN